KLDQLDQALEAFKQALVLHEQLGDVQETAGALVDLGVTYAAKVDYTNALDAYQKSKSLYESANIPLGVAAVLLNESMISFAQNEYAKTIEQADKAAALAKQYQDGDLFWQRRYRAGQAHYPSRTLDPA